MSRKVKEAVSHPSQLAPGDEAEDIITGIGGIVTQKIEFLNGCVQFAVQPPNDKNGAYVEPHYFDWQRLHLVMKGVIKSVTPKPNPENPRHEGGPAFVPGRGMMRG